MSLHGDGNSTSTNCVHDMLVSFNTRFECQKARDMVRIALENYEEFNVQVVQRMDRRIASFLRRIRELQDYLYDYGGPSAYYDDLADLKEELYECRIQQRENNSHALFLAQKWKEKQLYLDGLEMQYLQQKSECVKHKVVDVQPKVCVHSNLDIALDVDCKNGQHVGNDTVSLEMICNEELLEDLQIPDCNSHELLLDNLPKEENHVVESLPLVPSTLHESDMEIIGDIVAEVDPEPPIPDCFLVVAQSHMGILGDIVADIAPEPPPLIVFRLLEFDDPLLRAFCLLTQQDLRTNLSQGGGDDTPINAYGNVDNLEDHKSLHKEESEAQQAAVQQPHSTMVHLESFEDYLEGFEESYKCLGPEMHLYEPWRPKSIISYVED